MSIWCNNNFTINMSRGYFRNTYLSTDRTVNISFSNLYINFNFNIPIKLPDGKYSFFYYLSAYLENESCYATLTGCYYFTLLNNNFGPSFRGRRSHGLIGVIILHNNENFSKSDGTVEDYTSSGTDTIRFSDTSTIIQCQGGTNFYLNDTPSTYYYETQIISGVYDA